MKCHSAKFSLARGAIVPRVTNNSLTFWEVAANRLVQNLLQRVEQLASLAEKQFTVSTLDGHQTTSVAQRGGGVEFKARALEKRIDQFFSCGTRLTHKKVIRELVILAQVDPPFTSEVRTKGSRTDGLTISF